jgi:hypothetical protein
MTRWKDNRLDLGALGGLEVWEYAFVGQRAPTWHWEWNRNGERVECGGRYRSELTARRSAESWLRRALKQAAKRVEGKVTCT